ncbi:MULTISPECIES: hypothetical protein [Rhodopseudomonas]|uniref:hypothetical protein n=1 Tax=Rhodopseudomonas TaxID=1073 RepID=UPI00128CB175|nr:MULTISPECIES: hypothetical protein [Rhodopseudomonas]MDF3813289.1 hypothetical protein [Rhodopseudomonas sp. BAL398]WOK20150.1 hypothetical protein RBJ75_11810 [Rhodopseudomonas sp. BAL398]
MSAQELLTISSMGHPSRGESALSYDLGHITVRGRGSTPLPHDDDQAWTIAMLSTAQRATQRKVAAVRSCRSGFTLLENDEWRDVPTAGACAARHALRNSGGRLA